MSLAPRMEQRLGQTLVMTPQLRQAIKLLQFSNLELSSYVEQELEKNPFLERAAAEGPVAPETPAPSTIEPPSADADGAVDGAAGANSETLPTAAEAPLDTSYENVFDGDNSGTDTDSRAGTDSGAGMDSGADSGAGTVDGLAGSRVYGRGGRSDFTNSDDIDENLTSVLSLRDHLGAQLAIEVADPVDRAIGLALIEMVDDAGYLTADLDAVADALGCARTRIDALLDILQGLEPAGLFARSLAECLALQLREKNRLDPAMQALLDNLELVARRDMPGLLKVCGVDREDLTDMIAEIRALNPKPGLAFSNEVTQTVVADILVRPSADGGWLIELNAETLPRLLVNRRYQTELGRHARSKADKAYIAEQTQSANWLVRSLDQRAQTILKVATEILTQQDGFLRHGVEHLRPLTLREVAGPVNLHESTVSRVTSNKYMATPRGLFELKYFFTAAIPSSRGGDAHSAEAVRHRIKTLIDAETEETVLSDDRLVEVLRAGGIDIARRTVAKYREALKIPSSVQRRRLKKAHF